MYLPDTWLERAILELPGERKVYVHYTAVGYALRFREQTCNFIPITAGVNGSRPLSGRHDRPGIAV